MDREPPYVANRPAEGCILAVAFCCLFWAALLIFAMWRGWL